MKRWIASFVMVTSTAVFVPAFAGDDAVALRRDEVALIDQHASGASAGVNPQIAAVGEPGDSVLVGAATRSRASEPWLEFGRSVADAAVPSCLDLGTEQDAVFTANGLLRMPFLMNAAADGACR